MIKKECVIKSKSNYGTDSFTRFTLLHFSEKEIEDAVHIEVHTVIPSNDLLVQYQKDGYTIFAEGDKLIGDKSFCIKVDTQIKGIKGLKLK